MRRTKISSCLLDLDTPLIQKMNTNFCKRIISNCPCGAFLEVQKLMAIVDCPMCKKSKCKDCYGDWHPTLTCEEFRRIKDPQNFEELVKLHNLQTCPVCGIWLKLDRGCNIMHCLSPHCKGNTMFCFRCKTVLQEESQVHNCI